MRAILQSSGQRPLGTQRAATAGTGGGLGRTQLPDASYTSFLIEFCLALHCLAQGTSISSGVLSSEEKTAFSGFEHLTGTAGAYAERNRVARSENNTLIWLDARDVPTSWRSRRLESVVNE